MKKPFIKWISAGMVACILGTGIGAGGASFGTAHAAANTATAVLYAKVQKERAAEVVKLVNQIRAEAGLKPLTVHTNLTKMAKIKAVEMYNRNYFNHTSPVYGSPFEMMDAFDITYRYAGENIAKGQWSAKEVVQDWMDSPGHRANILNKHYNLIGVGYYNGYWVQEFIGTGK